MPTKTDDSVVCCCCWTGMNNLKRTQSYTQVIMNVDNSSFVQEPADG